MLRLFLNKEDYMINTVDIGSVTGIISAAMAVIIPLAGFIVYCVEKRKSYNKLLAQLKRETTGNLKALNFSNYKNITPLTLDEPVFKKTVESLNNEITTICYYNNFKIPERKERKKAYKSISFIMNSINELEQLSPFNTSQASDVNLKRRLNNLQNRLIELNDLLIRKYDKQELTADTAER